MTEKGIYIELNELAQIKGVTSRAIRLSISKGRYTAREIEVHGGKSYEVLLSSVEMCFQEKYLERATSFAIDDIENYPAVMTEKSFVPDRAKEIALARLDLIKEWRKFRNSHHKKTSADKEFLDSYNSGIFYEKIFQKIGSVSIGTVQRWNRAIGFSSDYMLLTPNYFYSKQNEFRTTLSDQEKNIFMKLLLHPNKFSVGKAVSMTKHVLKKNGQEYIPYIYSQEVFSTINDDLEYGRKITAGRVNSFMRMLDNVFKYKKYEDIVKKHLNLIKTPEKKMTLSPEEIRQIQRDFLGM